MNRNDERQVRRLVESATSPDDRYMVTERDDVDYLCAHIDAQQDQIRRLISLMYEHRCAAANWRGAFWGLVLVHVAGFLAALIGNVPMLRW